jgi:hypothetical protein
MFARPSVLALAAVLVGLLLVVPPAEAALPAGAASSARAPSARAPSAGTTSARAPSAGTTSARAPSAGTTSARAPSAKETSPAGTAPLSTAALASSLGLPTPPRTTAGGTGATTATNPEAPVPVAASDIPPPGRRLSSDQVLEIANHLPKMRRVRAEHRGSYGGAYLKGPGRWQVSYFSRQGTEIGQVIISDLTGRVLEQWTGFQVAWTMARGYPGAFGRHVNALYIWLPLCALFLLPFVQWRRPFSLRHLDLLALLSLSVSLAFFDHGEIYKSVPLAYPPLLYLLLRMLVLARERPRRDAPGEGLRLLVPAPYLAIGVVFLIGFRIGLNVTDSNVIDVGYAGVVGAQRIVHDRPLYGGYPSDNEHGDTYGPVAYEAYVPSELLFGWSGTWDDLPAAHAAAIAFDLLAVGLIFLLGLRVRGPTLGIALAYAWVSYPFTLYALESNSNDTLVAVLLLATLLVAASPPARGAFAALAGLTKIAPLALAPLLAVHGLLGEPPRPQAGEHSPRTPDSARRLRALALFVLAFVLTAAVVAIPTLTHDSLHTIYERTVAYQANRGSPFSVWGLYGLRGWQTAAQIAAVALALALAVARLRGRPPADGADSVVSLAAACAAILIALQLAVEHWFYLYIPWFFGLVMLAVLAVPVPREVPSGDAGSDSEATPVAQPAVASAPALSSPLATA